MSVESAWDTVARVELRPARDSTRCGAAVSETNKLLPLELRVLALLSTPSTFGRATRRSCVIAFLGR